MSEYSNMVTILGYVQGILYLLSSIMKLVKFQKGVSGIQTGTMNAEVHEIYTTTTW